MPHSKKPVPSNLSTTHGPHGIPERPRSTVGSPPTLTQRRMLTSSHEKMQAAGKTHKPAGKNRRTGGSG